MKYLKKFNENVFVGKKSKGVNIEYKRDTGKFFKKNPGNDKWVEITKEEYDLNYDREDGREVEH